MAEPKEPRARTARTSPRKRIVLEAKLKIPAGLEEPRITKAQAAELGRSFKSDILASTGRHVDVMFCKMKVVAPRRTKRPRKLP